MELCKMAQEYRRNTALLELRKKQLLAAKRHAKQIGRASCRERV